MRTAPSSTPSLSASLRPSPSSSSETECIAPCSYSTNTQTCRYALRCSGNSFFVPARPAAGGFVGASLMAFDRATVVPRAVRAARAAVSAPNGLFQDNLSGFKQCSRLAPAVELLAPSTSLSRPTGGRPAAFQCRQRRKASCPRDHVALPSERGHRAGLPT